MSAQSTFIIDLKTANVAGAGTDGCVTLELCGTLGSISAPLACSRTNPNKFEKNNLDQFVVTTANNIGIILSIKLTLKPQGIMADWKPEYVEIGDQINNATYTFACPTTLWLKKGCLQATISSPIIRSGINTIHPDPQRMLALQNGLRMGTVALGLTASVAAVGGGFHEVLSDG